MPYVQKLKIQPSKKVAGAHLHGLYAEMYNAKHNHGSGTGGTDAIPEVAAAPISCGCIIRRMPIGKLTPHPTTHLRCFGVAR